MIMYATEIYERAARQHEHAFDSVDCEQLQIDRLKGTIYDRVSKYYTDKIDSGEYSLAHGYMDGGLIGKKSGVEYIHVGIYDNSTGEQVL